LAETLASVSVQTHESWECIIIDDGSTDNTRVVAEEYRARDARFCYVYQANGGMSSARNHGLRLAQGQYVQFLDADDLLVPQKLALQVALLEAQPAVDIIYGNVRYFNHGDSTVLGFSLNMQGVAWMNELSGCGEPVLEKLVLHNQMVMNAPLIRASLLRKVGSFSEDLHSMEDWEFWMRCALANACFQYDDRPEMWALVRVHPTSVSQNRPRMQLYEQKVRERLDKLLRGAALPKVQAINARWLLQLRKDDAVQELTRGKIGKGLMACWQLARESGHYLSYAKGALYWLARRVRTAKV